MTTLLKICNLNSFKNHLIKLAQDDLRPKPVKAEAATTRVQIKEPEARVIPTSEDIRAMVQESVARKRQQAAGRFREWAQRLSYPETAGGKYIQPLTERGPFGKWQMYLPFIRQHGAPRATAEQVSAWGEKKFVPILKSFWQKTAPRFKPGAYTKPLTEAGLPRELHPEAYTAMVHYMGPRGFRRHVGTYGAKWLQRPPAGPFVNLPAGEYLRRMYPEYMGEMLAAR